MSIKTKARLIFFPCFVAGTFFIANYFFQINFVIKYVGGHQLLLIPLSMCFYAVALMLAIVWKLDYGNYPWSL